MEYKNDFEREGRILRYIEALNYSKQAIYLYSKIIIENTMDWKA
jgi:hypothetical protein